MCTQQVLISAYLILLYDFCILFAESNMGFWKVVMEAPSGDGCLYTGATFLLTVQFPSDYPSKPPVVRFAQDTIIRHVNVNQEGRICHGILSRDWTGTMRVRDVFDCIYGLLLAPETQDALDSGLAEIRFSAPDEYAQLVKPVGELLTKDRTQWRASFDCD
jgi:ubiquitin-protein ligase